MRIQRSAAAAAVFAAVLLAGACSSSTKSTAGAPAPAATSSAAPAAVTVTSTVTSAPAAASSSSAAAPPTTASAAAGSSPAPAKSASGSACQSSNLKVTIIHGTDADPDPSKTNESATISFQNTGSSTCTMQGHPQVELVSNSGENWPLENQSGDVPKLSLPPGTSAFASLYVLSKNSGDGGQAFQVQSAIITPPDNKYSTTVPWPWTWPLLDQSAATHPGTFIGAVNSTGT